MGSSTASVDQKARARPSRRGPSVDARRIENDARTQAHGPAHSWLALGRECNKKSNRLCHIRRTATKKHAHSPAAPHGARRGDGFRAVARCGSLSRSTLGRNGLSSDEPSSRDCDNLRQKLNHLSGVISPPAHVDPEMKVEPPSGTGSTRVIPPPGSPGRAERAAKVRSSSEQGAALNDFGWLTPSAVECRGSSWHRMASKAPLSLWEQRNVARQMEPCSAHSVSGSTASTRWLRQRSRRRRCEKSIARRDAQSPYRTKFHPTDDSNAVAKEEWQRSQSRVAFQDWGQDAPGKMIASLTTYLQRRAMALRRWGRPCEQAMVTSRDAWVRRRGISESWDGRVRSLSYLSNRSESMSIPQLRGCINICLHKTGGRRPRAVGQPNGALW